MPSALRALAASLAAAAVLAFPSTTHAAEGAPPKAPPKRLAIRAGRLIDGKGGAPIPHAVILIEGERITAVGAGLAIPEGVEVMDLGRATVLPGLIDAHTHVTSQPTSYYEDLFRRSPIDVAVLAHVFARRTLAGR